MEWYYLNQLIPNRQNYVPRMFWGCLQKTSYEHPRMVPYATQRSFPPDVILQHSQVIEIWRSEDVVMSRPKYVAILSCKWHKWTSPTDALQTSPADVRKTSSHGLIYNFKGHVLKTFLSDVLKTSLYGFISKAKKHLIDRTSVFCFSINIKAKKHPIDRTSVFGLIVNVCYITKIVFTTQQADDKEGGNMN